MVQRTTSTNLHSVRDPHQTDAHPVRRGRLAADGLSENNDFTTWTQPQRKFFFPAFPPQALAGETSLQALNTAIMFWAAKAEWYRTAARWGTRLIILCSTGIPPSLLIATYEDGFLVATLIPGLLAAGATATASWLQFHRPYGEWLLYRHYQREGERQRLLFENGVEPYYNENKKENEKTLARHLADLERPFQHKWELLHPDDSTVASRGLQSRP
jgi:hypothetical protein